MANEEEHLMFIATNRVLPTSFLITNMTNMVENRSGAKQSPTLPKGHFGIFHFYDLREVSVLIPFLEHQLVKPVGGFPSLISGSSPSMRWHPVAF